MHHYGKLFYIKTGVVHADELFMMFSSLMFPALTHPDDIKVSNIMLDLWTSFATDG